MRYGLCDGWFFGRVFPVLVACRDACRVFTDSLLSYPRERTQSGLLSQGLVYWRPALAVFSGNPVPPRQKVREETGVREHRGGSRGLCALSCEMIMV